MGFINRVKETEDILRMMDNRNGNKIIILYGTTGVGKSGLVRKLMNQDFIGYRSIRVSVSKSSPDTIENLHYLNVLYKAVWELAQKKMFDDIPTPVQQGLRSWKRVIQFAAGFARAKAGIEAENRIFEPVEENSVIRKKDYLINVLNNRSFVVTIENVQNMDTQSYEIIYEILKNVKGVCFVFEYTCESGGNPDLQNFINELELSNAKIYCYEIKKLAFEEAKKLVPNYDPTVFDDNALKRKYDKANGNLVHMKMVDPAMNPEENPIRYSLDALNKDENFIINLIYLNEGKIDIVVLFKLLTQQPQEAVQFSHSSLLSLINNLETRQFIGRSGSVLAIHHDSIITELETQRPNAILYSAYRLLTGHYHAQKVEFPDDEGNIERLFSLYLKFSDEAILEILDDLKRVIVSYKYPQNVIAKLGYLRDRLMSKPHANLKTVYELSLMMLEVSYNMGHIESAEENLDTIFAPENPLHIAYKAGILALNNSNRANIATIKSLISQTQEGSRPRLVLELILLSLMMQMCPLSESKKLAIAMMEVEQYRQYMEFGFLLRNYAELVDDSESIALYIDCISFFESFGRKDLQAQVYISLSMCHAYKGELDISLDYLNKAVETTDIPLKENILLNNFAVLEMLEGRFSDQVIKNLNDSLLLTSNDYELIIVKCNVLIYYVSTQQYDRARETCEQIERSDYEQFQYEELLHIVYQNLLFYYDRLGETCNYEKYVDKIKDMLEHREIRSESKRYIQLMLTGERSDDYFYTQFPFRADFLGYWEFEINRELEHSQLVT